VNKIKRELIMTRRFLACLRAIRPTPCSLINVMALAVAFALTVTPSAYAQVNIVFIDTEGNPVPDVIAELHISRIQAAPQDVGVIDQIDRTFVPGILLIAQGQQVRFPNSDNVRHHVYSFSDVRQFSTPLYADEEVDPILFDQAGVATLGCNIHDSMVAYVYVSEWQDRYQSDELGRIRLDNTGADVIHVWHPWLQTPGNRQEIPLTGASNNQLTIELDVRDPSQVFGFRAIREENS